jgi:uncharacterized protein YjbI with pentapeptide repeats
MTSDGRSHMDVRVWPTDAEARRTLEAYLADLNAMADDGVHPELDGTLMDFRGADLSGLDLVGAYFFNANLDRVRMVGCDLYRATLTGAIATGADLSDADLRKAEFSDALAAGVVMNRADLFAIQLMRTDLRGAVVRDALLNSARLFDADFSDADLRGASLRDCRFGSGERTTRLTGAILDDNPSDGACGTVVGPVNLCTSEASRLVGGEELAVWFARHGAPEITVVESAG